MITDPTLASIDTSDLEGALRAAAKPVRAILDATLAGAELSEADAVTLFETEGADLIAVLAAANEARRQAVGERVTFVVNRNINFTNVCYMGCRFCNFAKRRESPDAELLPHEEVAARAAEAWQRGGTEVCIQGGLHPKIAGDHYAGIVHAIKAAVPEMHIHAFSPFEIWYGAQKSRLPYAEFLAGLRDAGLGSVPGTAAEILDVEVRKVLTQDKLSTDQWVEIVRAVHGVGLPSTATIMYGHVDAPRHWAAHIGLIRSIQKETGGFTEFVPLGFIHYDSPLYRDVPGVRPGPTRDEHLKMHAVARLMLKGRIDNIQASWVKLGPALAQFMLKCGANDLGGTLMNESISRAAGAEWGQEVTPREMVGIIRGAGRLPVQRSTLYGTVAVYDAADPSEIAPLVARAKPSAAGELARDFLLS
ncbi:MAG: 5-amino-6-(D-ribitylamino)uracil--L-tyrosine 4-hydroxyphenyl transferase CofH [Alphaproteobacteria bacterium]